jgi:hypothetical protein
VKTWLWALLPSALLAPFLGGVLTGMADGFIQRLINPNFEDTGTFTGAGLRLPPAFVSAHLGELTINDPMRLFAALVEMGPFLLLAPWIIWLTFRFLRTRRWLLPALSLGALVGFVLPVFITLETADRDMSRLANASLFIWMVLGISFWLVYDRLGLSLKNKLPHTIFSIAALLTLVGGAALFPAQMVAIKQPVITNFVQESDALVSKAYWDRLDQNALVFTTGYPSLPMVLFGRSMGRAYRTFFQPYPKFKALLDDPDPRKLVAEGYRYVYLDKQDWQNLTAGQKSAFQQGCVQSLLKISFEQGEARYLFDLNDCASQPASGNAP